MSKLSAWLIPMTIFFIIALLFMTWGWFCYYLTKIVNFLYLKLCSKKKEIDSP